MNSKLACLNICLTEAIEKRSSSSECGFAAQVAVGLEKIRQKQAVDSPELVGNRDF